MHLFAVSLLINVVTSFISGFILFLHKPRNNLKTIWGLFSFVVFVWATSGFLAADTFIKMNDLRSGLTAIRICLNSSLFIPIIFFNFVLELTQEAEKKKKELIVGYVLVCLYLASALIFPKTYVADVRIIPGLGFYPIPGPSLYLFPVYYGILILYGAFLIFRNYRVVSSQKQNQYKYVAAGFTIGAIGGGTTFLPTFGINVPPYGNLFSVVYVVMIAYAVVKHQLMDINIVIKRSLVYTILFTFITLFYLFSVMIFEQIFKNMLGYNDTLFSLGTIFMIAIIFAPLKNRIQDFVDKTFFKRTAMEIVQENELLRQEIVQSERYKTLASLTGGIVDELKNPLTTLIGYSHFYEKKADDKEFQKKFVEVLKKELEKINDLTRHLSEYSSPAPLVKEDTEIFKLVSETATLLKSQMVEHNVELRKELKGGEGVKLQIDPSQMRQALSNVIINAVEAMPNGGVLTVRTDVTPSRLRIEIQDTGNGIEDTNVNRIFDPFYSTKGHTGLGLSITQGIIHNHNGHIRVQSSLGKGATFYIDLPLVTGLTAGLAGRTA